MCNIYAVDLTIYLDPVALPEGARPSHWPVGEIQNGNRESQKRNVSNSVTNK